MTEIEQDELLRELHLEKLKKESFKQALLITLAEVDILTSGMSKDTRLALYKQAKEKAGIE